jgi:segregation and condensation protein B
VTYGTTDAFLEHFGLASLSDLPGAADMRAAGLLSLDLPADFSIPTPGTETPDEDPIEEGEDAPEFHTDFLGETTESGDGKFSDA